MKKIDALYANNIIHGGIMFRNVNDEPYNKDAFVHIQRGKIFPDDE